MESVPRPKAFHPLGLQDGVFHDADAPVTTRGMWTAPAPPRPDGTLLFCLHTVDLRDQLLSSVNHRPLNFADADQSAMQQWELDGVAATRLLADSSTGDDARDEQPVTLAYLTGQTPTGRKVGIVVPHRPFFFVDVPRDVGQAGFKEALRDLTFRLKAGPGDVRADFVEKPGFYGYEPLPARPTQRATRLFARVHVRSLQLMRNAAMRLQWGLRVNAYGEPTRVVKFETHEDRIDADQNFLDANQLSPSSWHVVSDVVRVWGDQDDDDDDGPEHGDGHGHGDGHLAPRPRRQRLDVDAAAVMPKYRMMLVDEEYRTSRASNIRVLARDDPVSGVKPAAMPPLLVASIDGEMASGAPGRMPLATRAGDEVIAVGLVFAFAGGPVGSRTDLVEGLEFERRIFLKAAHCEPIPGVIVHLFDRESALIDAVRRELFVHKKVDVVTGHNITKFDVKYLATRVARFAPLQHRSFLRFGALPWETLDLKCKPLNSPALGANMLWLLNGAGFVYLDTLLLCKQNHKLRENSLKCAAAKFLKDQDVSKFDLPYSLISTAIAGSPEDVMKLAAYCVQDCVVPLRLLHTWASIKDNVSQARVINIPMAVNVKVGQQQRVRNTLMRKAHHDFGMVMTRVNAWRGSSGAGAADDDGEEHESAVGGFVLDNVQGLHDKPVVVLDFASLYPSIQRQYNLCWSTMFGPGDGLRMKGEELARWAAAGLVIREFPVDTKSGAPKYFYFVQNVPGVFPQQLSDLLAARKGYKAAMAAAPKGSAAYQNADKAQAATKIVMNSGYGTANAKRGIMPCEAVGTVTCFMGRLLNQAAEDFCRRTFGTQTLYGDTDSIMVYFPEPEAVLAGSRKGRLAYAMDKGQEAQAAINAMFNSEVLKTECEKVYFPFLSSGKKTYAGLKFEPGDVARASEDLSRPSGTIESKGIRNVRRDVPLFCQPMANQLLDALFYDRSEDVFWDIVHTYTERAVHGGLPLDQYTLTREIKEGYLTQAVVQPHVAVSFAREYAVRGSAYVEGDRVAFVLVQEEDAQRGVKPAWLRPTVGGLGGTGGAVGDAADDGEDEDEDEDVGVDDGGGEDDDEFPGRHGRRKSRFAARSEGGSGSGAGAGSGSGANLAVHARHTDEVLTDPAHNHLDGKYYVEKGICSVLKQLMPHETAAQEELVRYAQRVQWMYAEARRRRDPRTPLARFLGCASTAPSPSSAADVSVSVSVPVSVPLPILDTEDRRPEAGGTGGTGGTGGYTVADAAATVYGETDLLSASAVPRLSHRRPPPPMKVRTLSGSVVTMPVKVGPKKRSAPSALEAAKKKAAKAAAMSDRVQHTLSCFKKAS